MQRSKHRAAPLAISAVAWLMVTVPNAGGAQALSGAACGRAEGVVCRTMVVTEATYGFRMAGGANERNEFGGAARYHIGMNAGFVTPIVARVGLGAVATVGIWDDLYAAVGPRIRYHASSDMAVDLTPQVIIKRGQPGAGKVILDVAAMYRDQVGVSVQIAGFQQYHYGPDFPANPDVRVLNVPSVFAGVRLGSKPGRIGMIADAVALVGAFALYYVACRSSDC